MREFAIDGRSPGKNVAAGRGTALEGHLTAARQPRSGKAIVWFLLVVGAACIVGGATWQIGGRYAVEKTLTALALPCGLIWVGLFVAFIGAVKAKQVVLSLLLAVIFVVYTLAGNSISSNWLVSTVEGQYYEEEPLEGEPLDMLIALGGSVGYMQSGEVQTGSAGDRAVLAARMYHRGKAKHLVATGFGMTPEGLDPMGGAKAAARVWQDLGVPEDAITTMPGTNTSEETAVIKQIIEESSAERVGLLTSAWHLPRAVRLAKKQGLNVVPVAADFHSNHPSTPESQWKGLPMRIVPNAKAFWVTSLVLKEYLAGVVGR